jgi:hypothetical protein
VVWWYAQGLKILQKYLALKLHACPANLILITLGLIPFLANAGVMAAHNNKVTSDYGNNILNSVPFGGTLIVDGDAEVFSTAYLQMVEKQRKDIKIYDKYGSVFENIYGRGFTTLLPESQQVYRARVFEKLLDSLGILYFTERPEYMLNTKKGGIYPAGLVYAFSKTPLNVTDFTSVLQLHGNVKYWKNLGYLERHTLGRTYQRLAESELWRKNKEEAVN